MAISAADVCSLQYVLALFWQTCFMLGVVKCLGVFLPHINVALSLTPTDNGVMFGIYTAAVFCPGPIVAYLYHRDILRRFQLVLGALLSSLGLIFASFAMNNLYLMTMVTLSGLGSSIMSTCLVIGLNEVEPRRFNAFYGVGKSGYACGMALVPLLGEFLMREYGWRGALRLVGALLGNIIPFVLILDVRRRTAENIDGAESERLSQDVVQLEEGDDTYKQPHEVPLRNACDEDGEQCREENLKSCRKRREHASEWTDKDEDRASRSWNWSNIRRKWKQSLFCRDPCQNVVILSTCVFSMVDGSWHAFLIPRAVNRGITPMHAVYMAISAAIASFFARAFSGAVSSRISTPTDIFLLMTVVNAVSLLLDILLFNYSIMLVAAFASSLSIASRATLIIIISKDRAPLRYFPLLFAISDISFGVGSLLGSLFVGIIADVSGSYYVTFWLLIALDCLLFLMMLPPRFVKSPLVAQM
ncbi:monocarboxylate transporter 6-like [Diadema setosum]|uniref:monocarboxylate transporter 6-like n=1 Tax=Diadema setosum TaxID=31175 RepID=UPI003B3A7599